MFLVHPLLHSPPSFHQTRRQLTPSPTSNPNTYLLFVGEAPTTRSTLLGIAELPIFPHHRLEPSSTSHPSDPPIRVLTPPNPLPPKLLKLTNPVSCKLLKLTNPMSPPLLDRCRKKLQDATSSLKNEIAKHPMDLNVSTFSMVPFKVYFSFRKSLDIEPNHVPSLIFTACVLTHLGGQSSSIVRSLLIDALRLDRTNPYKLRLLYKADLGTSALEAVECFEAAALFE